MSPKLRQFTARELILRRHGFEIDRQSGSHAVLIHADGRRVTVPVHSGLLDQRLKAGEYAIPLAYTVDGKPFVLPPDSVGELARVEAELPSQEARIQAEETEAARYSGGLVLALTQSTIATMKNTYAMLDQRRLALKYGLPQYLPFNSLADRSLNRASDTSEARPANSPTTPIATSQSSPAPSPLAGPAFEISGVDARPGESNSSWTRYGYKFTIHNLSASDMHFDATVEFVDRDGFPLDHRDEYDLPVHAFSAREFTGEELIDASIVRRVSAVHAKVRERRR